jgi:hypothetical protein
MHWLLAPNILLVHPPGVAAYPKNKLIKHNILY